MRRSPCGTEFLAEWIPGYRARRDRLAAGLKAAGFEIEAPRRRALPLSENAFLAPLRLARSGPVLLDGAKIATVPGLVFGPEGEGHLRFSFSVPEEMIAGGVEALSAFAHATSGRS